MITSLHSPHVEAVKALLGSRGNKERRQSKKYVVEGLSNIKELLESDPNSLQTLYLTEEGARKLSNNLPNIEKIIEVAPEVMAAMSDTVTPQGALAIAALPDRNFESWVSSQKSNFTLAYFWQIQDPGNAGTVIRAADAFGIDAIVFSDNSVDVFGPKVVRSTAGSLWHIPVFEEVLLPDLISLCTKKNISIFATEAGAEKSLNDAADLVANQSSIWIFGNEARGLPEDFQKSNPITKVAIPMFGRAESLNLATAAAVVMYALADAKK